MGEALLRLLSFFLRKKERSKEKALLSYSFSGSCHISL